MISKNILFSFILNYNYNEIYYDSYKIENYSEFIRNILISHCEILEICFFRIAK